MDEEVEAILGNNRLEDLSWLCSLSESELDMLISLKLLVLQRAKIIGNEELAQKFDLKMLRALVLVLMEYAKEKVESLCPGLANSTAFMDCCNLLKVDVEDILSIEELKACMGYDLKKRHGKRKVRPA
ncbi:hypothetical protein FEM48_Zijuj03G0058600 [Ziziphus jujuba var. spinosa]|uniref:Uncharacterized protein n=1 Tax=Ziziphus jujuba var. spinosa TaxID=714518 RepID=A0A978VNK0_ZIZJJ|nr:hypothetical protein FEM48_Zijuj03G0058600 [Ziziphus jujuba var. spinosa]